MACHTLCHHSYRGMKNKPWGSQSTKALKNTASCAVLSSPGFFFSDAAHVLTSDSDLHDVIGSCFPAALCNSGLAARAARERLWACRYLAEQSGKYGKTKCVTGTNCHITCIFYSVWGLCVLVLQGYSEMFVGKWGRSVGEQSFH